MSNTVIQDLNQEQELAVVQLKPGVKAGATALAFTHLGDALDHAVQAASPGVLNMVSTERKKEEEEKAKLSQLLLDLANDLEEASSEAQAPSKEAIFKSAGYLSMVEGSVEDRLEQELKNEMQMMKEELKVLKHVAEFAKKEGQLLNNYKAHPNYKTLKALCDFLKTQCPEEAKALDRMLQYAAQFSDPFAIINVFGGGYGAYEWQWFIDSIPKSYIKEHGRPKTGNEFLEKLMGQASGNPELFQAFMQNGQKNYQKRIDQLVAALSNIMTIVDMLKGNGDDPLFEMQAMLLQLEQVMINDNAKQGEDRKEMSDAVQLGLKGTMEKLIEARSKIVKAMHHHHHGIFGAIKDFFKSIVHKIANILKSVAGLVVGIALTMSGDLNGAESAFKKAGKEAYNAIHGYIEFYKSIGEACLNIAKGLEKGDFDKVLDGIKTFAVQSLVISNAMSFGPFLADTKYGEDMRNLSKIAVDATASLADAIVAGFAELAAKMGSNDAHEFSKEMLEHSKHSGEAVLTNPQFQTMTDIVAIVMIVAAAVSQQYWLAALMTVMLVANDFGGTQAVTGEIAKGIEEIVKLCNNGKLSEKAKEWSKVAADITLIAAVMMVGNVSGAFDTGAEMGAKQAATAASRVAEEEGIEMANLAADTVASEAVTSISEAAEEESQTAAQRAYRRVVDGAKGVLRNNGAALMTAGMTLGSTSLGLDLAKAIEKKGKHNLEMLLEIIQMVTTLALSIGGGAGIGMEDSTSALSDKVTSGLRKVKPNLADYLDQNAGALAELAARAQALGIFMNSGAQMGEGAMQLIQADFIKAVGRYEAALTVLEATSKDVNAAIKQNNDHLKQIMKGYEQIINNLDAPSLAGEGIARALMQNA